MEDISILKKQLFEFSVLKKKLQNSSLWVENNHDYTIVISPARENGGINKDVDICFVGLTHGDEVIGLTIINEILSLISSGNLELKERIAFVLANVPAALEQKRYLEKDLNRAFCVEQPTLKEEILAKNLEPLFARSKYIFDIHQTIQPSRSPFFIFEYFNKRQIELLNLIDQNLPLIISLETFSQDGLGIEEFAKPLGGITLTVELGEKGFHDEQKNHGVNICLRALKAVRQMSAGTTDYNLTNLAGRAYTWGYVGRYNDSLATLDRGWVNMSSVDAGQRLGMNGDEIIRAPYAGKIMFPKYNQPTNREIDLFRIVVDVNLDKLKKL